MEPGSRNNEFFSQTAAEVLSLFDKEFTQEEIDKFFLQIPTETGKDFFNSFPIEGKSTILVMHNLGEQRRNDLHEFVRSHATIQGGYIIWQTGLEFMKIL